MAAIQRLASNIKALLSVTKKYQDAGSVGDQSMSSDNAQQHIFPCKHSDHCIEYEDAVPGEGAPPGVCNQL